MLNWVKGSDNEWHWKRDDGTLACGDTEVTTPQPRATKEYPARGEKICGECSVDGESFDSIWRTHVADLLLQLTREVARSPIVADLNIVERGKDEGR